MYTYGNQFKTLDQKIYIGNYHIIRGKYYTGNVHSFRDSKQLKPIQKENTYYQYAIKYKDLSQTTTIQDSNFNLQNIKLSQQVNTIYILKNLVNGKIFSVDKETYEKYSSYRLLKKFKIKLKKITGFSSIIYNNKQIDSISDLTVREYIRKRY